MSKLAPVITTVAAAAALAIAAAVDVAAPIAERREGYRGAVYLDPAKIATQCFGETIDIDPSRIYSREQCAVKLRARMARDYAPALTRCMPVLASPTAWRRYTNVFGAALDAAYNAGPAAVCKRMAPLVNAARVQEACESLPGWYTTARNRKTGVRVTYRGLVERRLEERDLCVKVPA